jgi:ATP-dependent Clp protease adaptor protein ClpS
MATPEIQTRIKPNLELAEPSLYRVVYINDDVTSMEFVVSSLITHFSYEVDDAIAVTEVIHEKGSAIVAVLPYEIAEQRGIEVTMEARRHGYPLQLKIEDDS